MSGVYDSVHSRNFSDLFAFTWPGANRVSSSPSLRACSAMPGPDIAASAEQADVRDCEELMARYVRKRALCGVLLVLL